MRENVAAKENPKQTMTPQTGAVPIAPWQLAIASLLILLTGALSLALKLGLERSLAIAAARTVVQLSLIGYVLKWIFALDNPWVLLATMTAMIAVAAHAAIGRSKHFYAGILQRSFVSLFFSALLTTFVVTAAIIQIRPWYHAQYVIPLLGMILGNGLTGISLALDALLESLSERRGEVEMELAQGATSWEAARGPLSDAVRRGMIPNINAMMVVGIVSLPGMMTGQILAGADPLQAVKYQIIVMWMIAAATALGCIGIALLTYRHLFNERHQLMWQRIRRRSESIRSHVP